MSKTFCRFRAFSLAEALITLLIVCLITLASVPILTKKKRDLSNRDHGKWMCTLNSAGQHVSWLKSTSNGDADNPDTWTVTGSKCKFAPSGSARNFAISASGGGGGGAGADSSPKAWINEDASITAPGMYYMVAIGGGGGGGGSSDDDDQSRSGGGGGIGAVAVFLDETVTQLKTGRGGGGSHGTGSNDGHAGDAGGSWINVLKRNSNTGNTDTCALINSSGGKGGYNGQHGSDHAEDGGQAGMASIDRCGLSSSDFEYRKYAAGENDSYMRGKFLKKQSSWYDKVTGIGHPSLAMQKEVNKIMKIQEVYPEIQMDSGSVFDRNVNYWSLPAVDRLKRDVFCAIPGLGGGSKQAQDACGSHGGNDGAAGKDGFVGIYTKIYKSGEGGKAGEIVKNVFYPTLEKPLEITIGAGGNGGNRGSGYAGGTTIISNVALQPLSGGNGGTIKTSNLQAYTKTAGEDGENTKLYYKSMPRPAYGGFSGDNAAANGFSSIGFGAGGGGGGVSPETENNPGVGAKGSPGVVIIEW